MGKEVDNKFTWVIKNFCSLQSRNVYSDEFVVDGCKWRLLAFPKGNNVEYLSLYLDVAKTRWILASSPRAAAAATTTIITNFSDRSQDDEEGGESLVGKSSSKGLTPKEGEVIKNFLNDGHYAQLTVTGLSYLREKVKEDELCVFSYRETSLNSHAFEALLTQTQNQLLNHRNLP